MLVFSGGFIFFGDFFLVVFPQIQFTPKSIHFSVMGCLNFVKIDRRLRALFLGLVG